MLITLCHATYHCIKKPSEIRDLWFSKSIEKNLGMDLDDVISVIGDTDALFADAKAFASAYRS